MWFVDQARITVKAGEGGRGCSAFAQPPYTRSPYPDGGDGGNGGDVVVAVDSNLATLLDFHFRHVFAATRGGHGGSNTKTGRRGDDALIRVPAGTVIRDAASGAIVRDLREPSDRVIVACGGRGGYGNAARAASARQLTAKEWREDASEATPGSPGEVRQLILELKLIADVGIIGLPNAGKSSLLSRISTAKPKIGAYPFTTRYPVLGVVRVPDRGGFIAADIPGLIEGAHAGKGLGSQFLRHIERTRLLIHLIDMAAVDGRDPFEAVQVINGELAAYQGGFLQDRPQLLVANKMDLPDAQEHLARFERQRAESPLAEQQMVTVSCATGEGVPVLLNAVWAALEQLTPTG